MCPSDVTTLSTKMAAYLYHVGHFIVDLKCSYTLDYIATLFRSQMCALHGLAFSSWFTKEAYVANNNNDYPMTRHHHKDQRERYNRKLRHKWNSEDWCPRHLEHPIIPGYSSPCHIAVITSNPLSAITSSINDKDLYRQLCQTYRWHSASQLIVHYCLSIKLNITCLKSANLWGTLQTTNV